MENDPTTNGTPERRPRLIESLGAGLARVGRLPLLGQVERCSRRAATTRW